MKRGEEENLERAREVAMTGPTTNAKFIIEESTAYAVRRSFGGTTIFHKGRTERFIGGALSPITNARVSIANFVSAKLSATVSVAYVGTMMRSGHFCPYLSMTEPRIPAVSAPDAALRPKANPAVEIESVDCSTLKKIERLTIP
jgi:hypothetical protein